MDEKDKVVNLADIQHLLPKSTQAFTPEELDEIDEMIAADEKKAAEAQ